eukprot:14058895-Ditylum_brightwellii.AAC.1
MPAYSGLGMLCGMVYLGGMELMTIQIWIMCCQTIKSLAVICYLNGIFTKPEMKRSLVAVVL